MSKAVGRGLRGAKGRDRLAFGDHADFALGGDAGDGDAEGGVDTESFSFDGGVEVGAHFHGGGEELVAAFLFHPQRVAKAGAEFVGVSIFDTFENQIFGAGDAGVAFDSQEVEILEHVAPLAGLHAHALVSDKEQSIAKEGVADGLDGEVEAFAE